MMEDKKEWVKDISDLLKKDRNSNVAKIVYNKLGIGVELVTIFFKDGDKSEINVSCSSLSWILEEIQREVYGGENAYGKIEPWERWWEK